MATQKVKQERAVLKKYLRRYYIAREAQSTLEDRLRSIKAEFRRDPAAEPTETAAEIDRRISAQAEANKKCLLEIVDVIALLPDSTERRILEMRHIDCKSWREIQETVYLTRTPCYKYYCAGLDSLLSFEAVRAALWPSKKRTGKDKGDGGGL